MPFIPDPIHTPITDPNDPAYTGGTITGNTITGGGAISSTSGSVNSGFFQPWTAIANTLAMVSAPVTKRSTSPDLPLMCFNAADEHGPVTLILQPESTLSANEALKLMMLLVAYCQDADKFCAHAYVRKHNLERHFHFIQNA